jgi:hypothetical protein
MIKLKDLLKEAEDKDVKVSLQDQVAAFVKSNSKKFEKLIDDDEWDDFYDLAFDKFPEEDQDDVAQALNNCAAAYGWFEDEEEVKMQTEKDLETLAFGEKSQQKGIDTSDYDKKAKLPKNPENIKESFKKKGKIAEMANTDSAKVDKFLDALKASVKNTKIVNQIKDFIMIARLDPYTTYKGLLRDILLFYSKDPAVTNAVEQGLKESKKKEESYQIEEAEYKGRKVKLGKPFYTPGGPRKRAVYVTNDKGNVVKVGFGEPGMKIKKDNPARRRSFRARHNCDNPGPRWKARYWSCKAW